MSRILIVVFGLCLGTQALALTAKDRLANALRVSSTIEGEFSQNTQGMQNQSGSFKVKRPNRFIWQYAGKSGQRIISTGKRVWIEQPELEQAYHISLNKALGKSPALLLLNPGRISEEFELKDAGTSQGLEWVELLPKNQAGVEFENLYVGLSASTIKQIKLIDALNRTTIINFINLSFDVPLGDELFEYSPPAGFDSF